MLLGVVIDDRGLVPDADVKRMTEFGELIRSSFGNPLASISGSGKEISLNFKSPSEVSYVVIREDITKGENVREYKLSGLVDGKWKLLATGSCIGHKRIEVIKKQRCSAVKLEIVKSAGEPVIKSMACY